MSNRFFCNRVTTLAVVAQICFSSWSGCQRSKNINEDVVEQLTDLGFTITKSEDGKTIERVSGDFDYLESTKLLKSLGPVQTFYLWNVDQPGIDFLSTCTELEGLRLYDPDVESLEGLKNLNLKHFGIYVKDPELRFKDFDLSGFTNFERLQTLTLSGKANWTPPGILFKEKLPRLSKLTLVHAGINDFSFLNFYRHFTDLDIETSAMNPDFSAIGNMTFFKLRLKANGEIRKLPSEVAQLKLDGIRIVNPNKMEWPEPLAMMLLDTGIADYSFLNDVQSLYTLEIKSSLKNIDFSIVARLGKLMELKLEGHGVLRDLPPKIDRVELDGVNFSIPGSLEKEWKLFSSLRVRNSNTRLTKELISKLPDLGQVTLENVPQQDFNVFVNSEVYYLEIPVEGVVDGQNRSYKKLDLILNSDMTTGLKGFRELSSLDIRETAIIKKEQIEMPKRLDRFFLREDQYQNLKEIIGPGTRVGVLKDGEDRVRFVREKE